MSRKPARGRSIPPRNAEHGKWLDYAVASKTCALCGRVATKGFKRTVNRVYHCKDTEPCDRRSTASANATAKTPLADDIAAARQRLRDAYGTNVDPLPLVAIALTVQAWRRTEEVEDAHTTRYPVQARITDGEMFAANVATTRLILNRLIQSYPKMDWMALADEVVDPNRVAGHRTVSQLLGKARHKRWAAHARRVIDTRQFLVRDHGAGYCWGEALLGTGSVWWGHPDWELLATTFIDGLDETPPNIGIEDLRSGLLSAPDALDPEILDWCTTRLIGYTQLRRRPGSARD